MKEETREQVTFTLCHHQQLHASLFFLRILINSSLSLSLSLSTLALSFWPLLISAFTVSQ